MQVQPHDWSVPAPLRALLWWPPVAFLVVLLDPTAAAGRIAVVGAVLAVVGVLGATIGAVVARRWAQGPAGTDEPSTPAPVAVASTALAAEQQAA